tara:strand:+ start:606 stop:1313 length:708 start_codon:yes stop_codon:yes gene_type:complete
MIVSNKNINISPSNKFAVIIPAKNEEKRLPETLKALGTQVKVIVVDGSSDDKTIEVAKKLGADVISSQPSRGLQLHLGAQRATEEWLIFLHADTVLSAGWLTEVMEFVNNPASKSKVGFFKFKLDDESFFSKICELTVFLRNLIFCIPYGDQGLLIRKDLYISLGGYKQIPLMEDLDMSIKIGRKRFKPINVEAVTSGLRYKKNGYIYQSLKNFLCFFMYFLGFPLNWIVWIYDK